MPKSKLKLKKKKKVQNASVSRNPTKRTDKGAPRLIFTTGGPTEGFNNSTLSQFNDVNPSSAIREFIQNSLDAAIQAGKEAAEIHFIVEDTKCSEIPGMEEYKIALESSIKELQNMKAYNDQSVQVAKRLLTASNKSSFPTLFVIDNGVGFDKKSLEAMCGDGISIKENNDNAAGSYGNGHLTAFSLSELQYIFYGGVQTNNSIFGGHAIIASHKKENEIFGKDGYYACKFNTKELYDKFSFPTNKEDMPAFIKPHINFIGKQKWESGAIIAVPAFNNFGKSAKEVSDLIIHNAAINFFVAIHEGTLRINVNINNQNTLLNKDNLSDTLKTYMNQRQPSHAGFPSGANAWNSYQTLIMGEDYTVETAHGKIQMRIRKDDGERNIVLCRNGMWISKNINRLRRAAFANKKPFDLVILAKDSNTSAYKLFKAAEGPLHNDIIRKRLGSNADKKKFDECLDSIAKQINELIDDSPTEVFTPPNFMSLANVKSINPGTSSTQRPTQGQTGTRIHKIRKNTSRPPRPSSSGNTIQVKMSSRKIGPGLLDVYFEPSDKTDDGHTAELRMRIDKGSDATCTSRLEKYDWDKIRFKSVKINDQKISENNFITDDNKIIGVNIGVIKAMQQYKMEIEYDDTYLPISGDYTILYDFFRRKKTSQSER